MDKRTFRVLFLKNIAYILAFSFFFLQCGVSFGDREENVAELKISGLVHSSREDVLALLGRDAKDPTQGLAPQEWKSWVRKLESHPRYSEVKIEKNRAVLNLYIVEEPVLGVAQIENDIYELGDGFRLLSKNELRSNWLPILTGDFRIRDGKMEGANFQSLWKQSLGFKLDYPDVWSRLSEIEARKDGDIFLYLHHPQRMKVNMGSFLSSRQGRKLYASLAYLEAENVKAEFLDLRGDDGFYY